ncbi:hypothetical protein NDU88_005286 [Pleurodeles waltl]|uniref:Uncharacterized protein n=1 Tax=Pleurodeles waltl TaxID=8319 RepID=A0AAV7MZQ5_PLEWA|nr:hypothetical protein NDU88_005286 [Pleurodeles waltl]
MPQSVSHAAPVGEPRSRLLNISAAPVQASTRAARQSGALVPASTDTYCQSFSGRLPLLSCLPGSGAPLGGRS